MKLTFLGSGSAFVLAKENYHSNILIESCDTNLLFDAGTTIPDALDTTGLTPLDIKNIYISHNHADHAGGMEYLGYKTYFTHPFGNNKPNLYGLSSVMDELWIGNLKSGMSYLRNEYADIKTYFTTNYIPDNNAFKIGDLLCRVIETYHIEGLDTWMPSSGLLIYNKNISTIFITGDTTFRRYAEYDIADVIFQDCDLANYTPNVHAQYHELCGLPTEIKAKMWLYHYTTDGGTIELPNACEDGFLGFVKRGESFEF